MEWIYRARCRDEDPELFFPNGMSAMALRQTERAKAVCALCDVRAECLEWALHTGQESGVWGGLSEDERRGLPQPVRAAPAGAELQAVPPG